MAKTTCIRKADWVVAWDGRRERHVYARDADVAFAGNEIVHVGGPYPDPVDEEIDGAALMVMPGLVNIHCHPSTHAIFRGYTEEYGNPRLFNSGRDLFRQSFQPDAVALRANAVFTLAELLAGGVTTIADLSHAYTGWLDLLARSGIRACVAPMYRSARWYTDTGQETKYEWYADGGRAAFAEAIAVMDEADRHPCGRLFSMVSPAQVDTCTEELLLDSIALAKDTGRPLHVHAAQSYAEFNGMARRNNATSIEWLHSLGVLSGRTVIGHAVFTDEHPWMMWPTRNDLRLLAETGTSVAHAPTVFARDGTLLHDLGRYLRAGINIGIGTDTHPHNLLEEMRWAEVLARVASGTRHCMSTEDVFGCATVGGARALGRSDLGRLAPGCKADIVLIDLEHPAMRPLRDPLRSLVYAAADRAVRDVYVDGRRVVEKGRVLTLDRDEAGRALETAQRRVAAAVPGRDPERRTLDDIVPLCLPLHGNGEP
ncbi:MAG: amidohydrolase family protein [Proteobacteria bacterium]|nr:amidohydrolase family protein [Pseudomonadota bacterium]